MKVNFNKTIRSGTGATIKGTVKTITYVSLSYDELLELETASITSIAVKQQVQAYTLAISAAAIQKKHEAYLTQLNKEVTNNYTIEQKLADIADIETKYPYLVTGEIPLLNTKPRLKKVVQRVRIKNEVRSTEDSIADLAKWNSLLTSFVLELYGAMEQADIMNIPDDKKQLIELAKSKFLVTETWADHLVSNRDLTFIEKIMSRENKIKSIVVGEL